MMWLLLLYGCARAHMVSITLFLKPGVFNVLSSRANLHLSYNPAGRSHADYKIIVDTLNIIIGAWAARLILQPLHGFTYVTAHSPTLPPLQLRHSSFYSPSVASPTSQLILQPFRRFIYPQLILQPFRRFTYVTCHSTTIPLLHLRHRHFTYFTWRAAHPQRDEKTVCGGLACYSELLSLEGATVLDSC